MIVGRLPATVNGNRPTITHGPSGPATAPPFPRLIHCTVRCNTYLVRYDVSMSSAHPEKDDGELPSLADLLPRRTRPRSRARQPSLSREQIVRVAVELADAEGPDAISMRRIAARLGVGAMTLYGYVADRDALLAHMINEVVAETGPWGVSSGSWRADLECHARQFRDLCLRHSWLPVELGTAPFLIAPRLVAAAEFVLTALEPHGIDPDTAGAV